MPHRNSAIGRQSKDGVVIFFFPSKSKIANARRHNGISLPI
ncbi:MAG: hypothetical protein ABFD61_00430 [Chloroherpetonaceae bacterium]